MLLAFLRLNIHCRVSVKYARRLEKNCRRLEKYCRRLKKYCRRFPRNEQKYDVVYHLQCRLAREIVGSIHDIMRCCIANYLPSCMYACVFMEIDDAHVRDSRNNSYRVETQLVLHCTSRLAICRTERLEIERRGAAFKFFSVATI